MNDRQKDSEKSPKSSSEQDTPQQVRPETPQEKAGQSIQELNDPPQAEGDRESADK